MLEFPNFYINGQWVAPSQSNPMDVIDPSTEQVAGRISMGGAADVDAAVQAAKAAFPAFSQTSAQERIALLESFLAAYQERYADIAEAIRLEMGAPVKLATQSQAGIGLLHTQVMIDVLKNFKAEEEKDGYLLRKEPIGVCGFITPWNWPVNQIACKVLPALAAGCTMVLKPSEVAPLSAGLWAEVMDAAGVPAGVFNLVNGDGPTVGSAISSHPDVDMMSFTGSTRAGTAVAVAAAPTVKRVTQELGGKSANIILEDADIPTAVAAGVAHCFNNTGQSCNAPTRMLVPEQHLQTAIEAARAAAESIKIGPTDDPETGMGPVVSKVQYDRIQSLIQAGIDEGAELVVGGTGRAEPMEQGYYVKPTVFANVHNDMTVARQEIFGPVLAILPYQSEAQAIEIANDTEYGLAGYVQGTDLEHARQVANQIRAGQISINGASSPGKAPFGGYKQSGNGREWGVAGFEEFLETKAIMS